MKIDRINGQWNKVNTKKELTELLKKYEGILSASMIDYLNSLIGLEFSVVRAHISDSDRLALSDLDIYNRIAIYNVYNRALNIFKQDIPELRVFI